MNRHLCSKKPGLRHAISFSAVLAAACLTPGSLRAETSDAYTQAGNLLQTVNNYATVKAAVDPSSAASMMAIRAMTNSAVGGAYRAATKSDPSQLAKSVPTFNALDLSSSDSGDSKGSGDSSGSGSSGGSSDILNLAKGAGGSNGGSDPAGANFQSIANFTSQISQDSDSDSLQKAVTGVVDELYKAGDAEVQTIQQLAASVAGNYNPDTAVAGPGLKRQTLQEFVQTKAKKLSQDDAQGDSTDDASSTTGSSSTSNSVQVVPSDVVPSASTSTASMSMRRPASQSQDSGDSSGN